jgi:hypothetical protein
MCQRWQCCHLRWFRARGPVTGSVAARTLGVKEITGMMGESRPRGAYRGSERVQSAPGEPLGWSPGGRDPLIPEAGRKGALENLRSIISATFLPLAISPRIAGPGTMGMVHPVLLTQMLVVARGVPCAFQLRKHARHVLPAGISQGIPTTSASEHRIFPLFPWSDRGSLEGAASMALAAPVPAGASPADRAVRKKTGEIPGHGGSRTTAQGNFCAIPSPKRTIPLNHPPYISELH